MTKIERKLKKLGYKCRSDNSYRKAYKLVNIIIYKPSGEEDFVGYITLLYYTINSDEEIKDLQIAWNILKSDLKEIKENGK